MTVRNQGQDQCLLSIQFLYILEIIGIDTGPFNQTVAYMFRLIIKQYPYRQPQEPERYNGHFDSPRSIVSIALTEKTPPFGFQGRYYEGTWYRDDVVEGSFTMGLVSRLFRRATLEIHTVIGIGNAPKPVGSESFESVFESAGWDLNVIYNRRILSVPEGVNASIAGQFVTFTISCQQFTILLHI
jgi:hypothetical protein